MADDHPQTNNTDIRLANAALAMIGAGRIFSFDEDTPLADAVNAAYVDVIETCLAAHGWSFGKITVALQREARDSLNGYAHAFALPAGRIGLPLAVLIDPRSKTLLRDYDIQGATLFADPAQLWATTRYRPAVELWPAPFRLFAAKALAAAFCVPVTQDARLAGDLDIEAWGSPSEGKRGGLFMKAMAQDVQQPGPQPIAGDTFTDAWRGAGSW